MAPGPSPSPSPWLLTIIIIYLCSVVCFQLLDTDQDGRLNRTEMKESLEMMKKVQIDNAPPEEEAPPTDASPGNDEVNAPTEEERQPCCNVDSMLEQFEASFQVQEER